MQIDPRLMPRPVWDPDELAERSRSFEEKDPIDLLHWGFETFGTGLVAASGFGPSGIVILHLLSMHYPDTEVFYIDTGVLFPETYALRERLQEELGIRFTRIATETTIQEQDRVHGPNLWDRNADECCRIRKVEPLRTYLSGKQAWISGLRRSQSASRARTPLITYDYVNNLVKLNPLATWSSDDVWTYLHLYDLPFNELHDRGYPSIGCMPCTQPVAPGEDERAGRWRGLNKVECGIHIQPTKP